MNQIALIELRLAVLAGELGADLVRGIVEQQFVIAATWYSLDLCPDKVLFAGSDPVPLKVGGRCVPLWTTPVIEWAVDIAFDEVDDDFLPDARDELRSPCALALGDATRTQVDE